jgi:hypothetical protein
MESTQCILSTSYHAIQSSKSLADCLHALEMLPLSMVTSIICRQFRIRQGPCSESHMMSGETCDRHGLKSVDGQDAVLP